MKYKQQALENIIFPLGGIGTGAIGVTGNGYLVDWEIFNRPNKGSINKYSCFAVRAELPDGSSDTRILQGDWRKDWAGKYTKKAFKGYGYGPEAGSMCAFPHFKKVVFEGSFPIATWTFTDDTFPAKVTMKAFNPFIPLNAHDSGLPAAFFEISVKSLQPDIRYTVLMTVSNPFPATENLRVDRARYTAVQLRHAGVPESDKEYGDLTVAVDAPERICQQYWYRGESHDKISVFWHDLTEGPFADRVYHTPGQEDVCSVGARAVIGLGQKKQFRFLLSWNMPNCYNYWNPCKNADGEDILWKNYYATQFRDSMETALYCLKHWTRLYRKTDAFRKALHGTTLDPAVVDAISANLAVLKSPTVLRLEDGTLYGWEGVFEELGSCEGTCTHVWSYGYALCFLFPELERSLRETEFQYDTTESGYMYFRTSLPLGRERINMPPCLDGQMATIIKIYRDWKITGNSQWLRENWGNVQKVLDFAWHEDNACRWDRDHDGVLEGRQHHTLDKELFGPSSWLQGMYLAALKAAERMAHFLGNLRKEQEYGELFQKGYAYTKEQLFNGEYFCHKVDLERKAYIEEFGCPEYWDDEHGQLKYQIAEGCEIDQMLGQWHANICGLGDIFDPEQRKTALKTMWRNNFKPCMRDFVNMCRVYALNEEAGTVMCDYPENREKPMIPILYTSECMTGFEYAFAGLLISEGMIGEGLTAIRAIRDRYDGVKRNPYNEIECGNNYARSMASFALLPIFGGMEYDLPNGHIGFAPLEGGKYRSFWCLGTGWGEFVKEEGCSTIFLQEGSLTLRSLRLGNCEKAKAVFVDGKPLAQFDQEADVIYFAPITIQKSIAVFF